MQPDFDQPLRVGEWMAYPDRLEIQRRDETLVLEPRVMGVLMILSRAAGEVVSKQRLLDLVWHDVVVADGSVSLAVHKLRRAFADDRRQPRYIQTVPRRGYRLIAAVEASTDGGPAASESGMSTPPAGPSPSHSVSTLPPPLAAKARKPSRGKIWLPLALAFLVGGLGGAWFTASSPPTSQPGLATAAPYPLTSAPGVERQPALSPSGDAVLFAARSEEPEATWDLWLQNIAEAEPRRLTADPQREEWPAWSPDGRTIAYFRRSSPESLELVSRDLRSGTVRPLQELPAAVTWGLTWSLDGRTLIYSRHHPELGYRLVRLDLADGQERDLTHPPSGLGDGYPVISPDDGSLAFGRGGEGHWGQLWVQGPTDSTPRLVTEVPGILIGLTWSDRRDHLIYGLQEARGAHLWEISIAGGTPRRLDLPQELAAFPALRAGRLVFEHHRRTPPSIRRRALGPGGESRAWGRSTAGESAPRHGPDGRFVAFASRRGGGQDLWIARADGSQPRRLTSLEAEGLGDLAWSPRGDRIAFSARVDQKTDLFVVDIASRLVERWTHDVEEELAAAWAADGSEIYFTSAHTGRWEIWKMTRAGAEPIQVTQRGGIAALAANDGSGITFRGEDGRLMFLSFRNHRIRPLPAEEPIARPLWRQRQASGDRIHLLDSSSGELSVLEPDAGEPQRLANLNGRAEGSFSVSPSGHEVLYTVRGPPQVDLAWQQR
ncbi:MAG: winged helix-turn-helix domain-containing protein [Acidobacteriota bacterium]